MSTDLHPGTVVTIPQPPERMSYADFLSWHPGTSMAEWVDGEVFVMAPPSLNHQRITFFIATCMRLFVEVKRLGEIFIPPVQMKLARAGREPDVLFVSATSKTKAEGLYLSGPADLAVEVVSPDSGKRDRVEKFREYQEAGVREYWLIDAALRHAQFFGLDANGIYQELPVSDDGIFHSRVLDGLWIDTNWLWQEPLPSVVSIAKSWGIL